MLYSMTGHGQAQQTTDGVQVWAEIRAVNNRYLKVTVSYSDRAAELESQVKSIVQKHIRRGAVHVNLEVQREKSAARFQINTDLLDSLLQQARSVDSNVSAGDLLTLPGVLEDASSNKRHNGDNESANSDWELLQPVIEEAMQRLVEMRQIEGASAAKDLLENSGEIAKQLKVIEGRAPQVASDYAIRLTDRINHLLAEHEVSISPADIVREVGIFADKADISEEVVRLNTHIEQFSEIINSGQSDGRKLEFVSQEMLRETNTIGSKANDSVIAQSVVEIKTAIDRIREMTQNVE